MNASAENENKAPKYGRTEIARKPERYRQPKAPDPAKFRNFFDVRSMARNTITVVNPETANMFVPGWGWPSGPLCRGSERTETPILRFETGHTKSAKKLWDIEGRGSFYWVVRPHVKDLLEKADPDGFQFTLAKTCYKDGSPAPDYWLVNIKRELVMLTDPNKTSVEIGEGELIKALTIPDFYETLSPDIHAFTPRHRPSTQIVDDTIREILRANGVGPASFQLIKTVRRP